MLSWDDYEDDTAQPVARTAPAVRAQATLEAPLPAVPVAPAVMSAVEQAALERAAPEREDVCPYIAPCQKIVNFGY